MCITHKIGNRYQVNIVLFLDKKSKKSLYSLVSAEYKALLVQEKGPKNSSISKTCKKGSFMPYSNCYVGTRYHCWSLKHEASYDT